ncbi:CRISPR-associated protein Cas4 [Sulfobacillus acidophilus TPY]|uniref:CRISPR-associated exonuclease Cas4 n=1 Tax=Sulfobacillus acidophilus (strain ATCC 700253 / DSM 10332 / NAL) TaxID=679936 RepID=G8TT44_SULAD|nr:CRISPR-associated protein Cas4 [Sulfobacillus acidophilus TPY]AEW06744.1 CRISPR-associated exonuclease, Cas4 family [Sulfobacillus acidophilus DSM 10332]
MVDDLPELRIQGTWVWYYAICRREVWLMTHAIQPDEDDPNLDYGRFLHERALTKDGEEVLLGVNRLDRVIEKNGDLVVIEIKKSSQAVDSARLQLAHYLRQLELRGVQASGELRFPEERRKEVVYLTDNLRDQLEIIYRGILAIIDQPVPPAPEWIKWCAHCAYRDFCWS